MPYQVVKRLVIGFLCAYFAAGIAARFLSPGTEDFYPFFSWFLFSEVPARVQRDFAILIHETGGRQINPPILFEKADGVYQKTARSPSQYYQLTRSLALAVAQNQTAEVLRLRQELEKNFLSHPVRYEAVEILYNPIERWKSGQLLEVKSLATFISQEP